MGRLGPGPPDGGGARWSAPRGRTSRSIARDLGDALGSGAFLGALVRTASGGFRLDEAVTLDALRAAAVEGPAGVASLLRPVDAGLEDLPHPPVTGVEVRRLGEGLPTVPRTPLEVRDAPVVLAVGPDGDVVAVCRAAGGVLHPHKVLAERVRGTPDAPDAPDAPAAPGAAPDAPPTPDDPAT